MAITAGCGTAWAAFGGVVKLQYAAIPSTPRGTRPSCAAMISRSASVAGRISATLPAYRILTGNYLSGREKFKWHLVNSRPKTRRTNPPRPYRPACVAPYRPACVAPRRIDCAVPRYFPADLPVPATFSPSTIKPNHGRSFASFSTQPLATLGFVWPGGSTTT